MKIGRLILYMLLAVFALSALDTRKSRRNRNRKFGKSHAFMGQILQPTQMKTSLRVMTFNTWHGGIQVHNGTKKIAEHILETKPDIVGLQEMFYYGVINIVLSALSGQYQECSQAFNNNGYSETRILTRLVIAKDYGPMKNVAISGCRLRLPDGSEINVWNAHLDYKDNGPEAACKVNGETANRPEDLVQLEKARLDEIKALHNHRQFKENLYEMDTVPILLMGTFETPSHLDWIEATKSNHCGWSFEYPTTKYVEQQMSLTDSYRVIHPSPSKQPGNTYSPVANKDPQDRIDYIFYGSGKCKGKICLKPHNSFVHHGAEIIRPYADRFEKNNWPSDHSAVITDFKLKEF